MSKRKLLLADDSITIQKVVNLTFADEGIEVIAVGDGDSAMRKFDEFIPDLVMADVNMPGLSGYEICRIIKQTEETKRIPVILLVGSFEPFNEDEAKEVGADDFLTKPFQSIRQLVNKVTDLLNRKEEPVEAPVATPVDSFADTLEFEKHEEAQSEFGDAGMDDEMIETSPANDYLSDADSVYQRETTIDYAKTQPLNSEDLKGFNIVSNEEQSVASGYQNEDAAQVLPVEQEAEETPFEDETSTETAPEASEPPSFDEEARKMGFYEDEPEARPVYSFRETNDFSDYSSFDETADEKIEEPVVDNFSENEPQIDYALPVEEPAIEKEITEAETLEPEISYEPESPREAVYSQATEEDETEISAEDSDEEQALQATEVEEETAETFENESPTVETFEDVEPATETTVDEESPAETAESETLETEDKATDEDIEEQSTPEAIEEQESTEDISEPETSEFAETSTEEETVAVDETPVEEPQQLEETETGSVEESNDEAPVEAAGETESEVRDENESEMINETPIPAPAASFAEVSPLDFADDDLLDLPPLVEETGIRPQPVTSAVVPEVVAPQQQMQTTEPESRITVTKTVAESEIALHFPPELIEAIAQKVADKISEKTLSEVLPQITELVVQKLAERQKE